MRLFSFRREGAFLIILGILAAICCDACGASGDDLMRVEIQPMAELDFMTRDGIFDMRRAAVLRYPALCGPGYEPSREIFGRILDGKPWWGMLGLCYYGAGDRSIAGLSEESRFILNPFLLVGLDEGHAYKINDPDWVPQEIYPVPVSLVWKKDRSFAQVTYDVSSFSLAAFPHISEWVEKRSLGLIAYNARDMGFSYMYVSGKKSKNVVPSNLSREALSIPFILHCGRSCGYPGGCNNMSPDAPAFMIKVNALPASAYIKLWNNKPKNTRQAADMIFVIEMI